MKATKDQLARREWAPPTQDSGNRIVAHNYDLFIKAAEAARQAEEVATQRAEEIARRQVDINTAHDHINRLEAENTQTNVERNHAREEAQRQRDVAKGIADLLALAGAPIPTEQLDVLLDGAWGRVERAHDELNGHQS